MTLSPGEHGRVLDERAPLRSADVPRHAV